MTNQAVSPSSNCKRQRGTVLVVALIMLLLMTMIGLGSMRSTGMEERMAGNWRDVNIAIQAAEAALRDGENWLAPGTAMPNLWNYPNCPVGQTCRAFRLSSAPDDATLDLLGANLAQWRQNATAYPNALAGVAAAPESLVEHRAYIRDHLTIGFGVAQETGRDQFRVTSRGVGQSLDAEALLQSHYAKRYN